MESAQCFHCWWEIARCGKIMQECLSNWHCFQDSKRIHILMWDAHLFFKRIWGGFGHETCITSIHQLAIFTGTRTKPRISWTSTRPPSAPGLLQPMLGKWYPQAGEIDGNRSFWLFSSLASPASQFPPRNWGVGSNPAENWFRAHIRWSYLCLKYGPLELHFFFTQTGWTFSERQKQTGLLKHLELFSLATCPSNHHCCTVYQPS